MFNQILSRRAAMTRIAALGAAAPRINDAARINATPAPASPPPTSDSLNHVGVNYDVGTETAPGHFSRPESHRQFLASEIATLRDDLHCTSVSVFGGEVERLVEGATAAADAGLDVKLQPRLADKSGDQILETLSQVASAAGDLGTSATEVVLDVGCELSIFANGIIPGESWGERLEYLADNLDQLPAFSEKLNALLDDLAAEARASFKGRLTYASGSWEAVDWANFDVVSVDLYRDSTNQDAYLDLLRAYHQFDKPVWITEFGCCSYEGAAEQASNGNAIVDWNADPPQLNGEYVRDESVQSRYIIDLLDVYGTEGVDGAYVYQFIEPDYSHSDDPLYDLDMASFGVIKTYGADSERPYEETGYWEPKEAFSAIAERFATRSDQSGATPVASD